MTGSQLAITLKLEPLYSSLKIDQIEDTKNACKLGDLLKHALEQATFTCPVKCNMVRQSKNKSCKSFPYSLCLAR